MEVLLNVVELASVTLRPHCRNLGPYPLALGNRFLIDILLLQFLFPITQLGEFTLVGSVLLNDIRNSVVLDLHDIVVNDNIWDGDGRRGILRDGDTTR